MANGACSVRCSTFTCNAQVCTAFHVVAYRVLVFVNTKLCHVNSTQGANSSSSIEVRRLNKRFIFSLFGDG